MDGQFRDWRALIAQECLPADYAVTVEQWWAPLAAAIAQRRNDLTAPLVVGISGAQGSGKTTLCKFLEVLLAEQGLHCVTLALDDFYLTRAERAELAARVHPLLATRGVPGTHDVALLRSAIAALRSGSPPKIEMPRFDKASDDRAAAVTYASTCDVVLLEGWCIGAGPQEPEALAMPVNPLERDEDPHGIWRQFVNAALAGAYAELFAEIDLLVALLPPDFAEVRANRSLQESRLEAGVGTDCRMDAAALDRFLAHYERITLALLEQLPNSADIAVRLGQGHEVRSVTGLS